VTLDDLPVVRAVPSIAAAQMAEVDRITIEEIGISVEALMENASHQIAAAARALFGRVEGKRIVALVGRGNNGGDSTGALRRLAGWGAEVRAEVAAFPDDVRETTNRQLISLLQVGPSVVRFAALDGPRKPWPEADLLIDGLLGYSARGAPRGLIADLIRAANASGTPTLAIDIPSGLDPDSGDVPDVAIRAKATVTLALPKKGLLANGARTTVGELLLADIGIPHFAFERVGVDTRRLFAEGDLLRIRH
jgi:NAD(P)H-hydrate epimerase